MRPVFAFVGAIVSFVVGVGLFFIKHLGAQPQVACVKTGQPTSGFAITKNGKDCPLSSADFQKYWEWDNHSALHLHQLGALLVLLSLVLLILGIVLAVLRGRRKKRVTT